MMNHYEMQQMMEAKRMEIDRQIEMQSFFLQGETTKESLSLFELFKKMFNNRKNSNQDECCANC
ncbi:hypothetical protein M9R32_12050 [Paenisporosarcina quisquiliarum]|uniref:Uncharacterized protein n=1 Tax=Paenisporosarcina quisquiliarum TaxID=365346 RepID=A0A9X3REZ5_9BACL|nr:hypothetical protein [Paenisporosarcina quisquiliarum]MCZ8537918.1 hypothetical protein [Paenisporosarcina quisquiliarum]